MFQFSIVSASSKSPRIVTNQDFISTVQGIYGREEVIEESVEYLPDGVEVYTVVTATKPVYNARSNTGTTTVNTSKTYKVNGLTWATFKITTEYWFNHDANDVGYNSYKTSCTKGAYGYDASIDSTPDETTGTDFLSGNSWLRLTFGASATGKSSSGNTVTHTLKVYNEIQSDGKTKNGLYND